MKVLGITAAAHNSAVAIVDGGALRFFAEEERYNREKNSGGFPFLALENGLAMVSAEAGEFSAITLFNQPWKELSGNLAHAVRYFPQTLNLLNYSPDRKVEAPLWRRLGGRRLPLEIRERFPNAVTRSYEHHLCHAASTFYLSPFDEAAILTLDGRGEAVTTLLAHGRGNRIKKISEIKVPHSLGHLYAAITWYLGFRPFHDEWKVMGLAGYGTPSLEREFQRVLSLTDDSFRLNLEFFSFHTHGQKQWLSPKFFSHFGPRRPPGAKLEQRHFDLAYALQGAVEKAGVQLARHLQTRTGARKLCLAGGVALNCLMNSRILKETEFEEVFIPPFVHDAGTAAGSALLYFFEKNPRTSRVPLTGPYLGHHPSEEDIRLALSKHGLESRQPADLAKQVASMLAEKKIIALMHGGMEAGPRALGNRSILADPRDVEMRDLINAKTKHRERFRPLAPVVLEEEAAEYFSLPKENLSPYMLLTAEAKQKTRALAPAIVHVDGSARVQTVSRLQNPLLHEILTEFKKITGVPILINTSFNDQEPVVCTPEDAINCFLGTKIDVLVMGKFMVERE